MTGLTRPRRRPGAGTRGRVAALLALCLGVLATGASHGRQEIDLAVVLDIAAPERVPASMEVELLFGDMTTRDAVDSRVVVLRGTAVDVVVRAGGLGMIGWRLDVMEARPLIVEMLPDRGSMRVPKLWNAVLRNPGGVRIPVSVLAGVDDRGQVQADDDEYVIRDLAPGTWTWCSSPGVCSAADVLPWAETSVSQ